MTKSRPIACSLLSIHPSERSAHINNARAVISAISDYEALPNGYTFQLPNDTEILELTGSFIARERLCCPFLKYELVIHPDEGGVWLTLTGNDGVKTFLESYLLPHLNIAGN